MANNPMFSLHQQSSLPAYPTPTPSIPPQPQLPPTTKELNMAHLCRFGQEMVQDLVQKMMDISSMLKTPLPNFMTMGLPAYNDRKVKLEESIKQQAITFKKVQLVYDKVNEDCMQNGNPDPESYIPIVGEVVDDRAKNTEFYIYATQEHKEYVEQVQAKNQLLKEIIDQIRTIIWEINTMITMRKT